MRSGEDIHTTGAFAVLLRTFACTQPILFLAQTVFLPVVGLVDPKDLKPGDLVGVNKDSYLILDKLPSEYVCVSMCGIYLELDFGCVGYRYDSRVKAFEVDEKPTEDYSDIGGLDKQIQVWLSWQSREAAVNFPVPCVGTDRGCGAPHDAQGPLQDHWNPSSKG